MSEKTVTLNDIAMAAGVSSATVSRYFSNPKLLAPRTAARIRKAVLDKGYTPNKFAQGLASKKSRLVSVLIPQLSPSIINEPVELLIKTLSSSGRVVILGVTEFDPQRTEELVKTALSHRAEAIVLTGILSPDIRKFLGSSSDTSIIEVWGLPEAAIDVAIGFSHFEVGRDLAQFLHQRGYRRPHHVLNGGPRSRERHKGFVKSWKALDGAELTTDYLSLPLQRGEAKNAFHRLIQLPVRPDVVICGADWVAQAVIVEALAAGLKVPEDLAVVGFGNSPTCEEMKPSITSVDVKGKGLAQEVLEVLDKRERNEPLDRNTIDTSFSIVGRESA